MACIMKPRLSAFPKCYLEDIAGTRTMSVFDWIDMARSLDADGLEMYNGFFTSLDGDSSIGSVRRFTRLALPCRCCAARPISPTQLRTVASGRSNARRRCAVARRLGGPSTVCRVLSGQRYPEVRRGQGIARAVEAIEQLLPVAKENGGILGLENH